MDTGVARGVPLLFYISEATVKSHLNHIFSKQGVDDRTAAVMIAWERSVIFLER